MIEIKWPQPAIDGLFPSRVINATEEPEPVVIYGTEEPASVVINETEKLDSVVNYGNEELASVVINRTEELASVVI